MRFCPDCQTSKPLDQFHKSKEGRGGYQSRCYPCHKEKYGIGSPQHLQHRRDLRDENRVSNMLWRCKDRALKLGVPFDMGPEDIKIPELCPVLRIPLFFTEGRKTPNTPSLDRMRPSLGYVRGNVLVISWRANRLKLNETDPAVFEAIADYIRLNGALECLRESMAKIKQAA